MKNLCNISRKKFFLHWEKLDFYLESEAVFRALYSAADVAFWLDSPPASAGRYSYMGDVSGPHAAWFNYFLSDKTLQCYGPANRETAVPRSSCEVDSLLAFLRHQLDVNPPPGAGYPLEFNGGFVGYLGFELKAECGYPAPAQPQEGRSQGDAAFIFADRFIAFDNQQQAMYVVALGRQQGDGASRDWLTATRARLMALRAGATPPSHRTNSAQEGGAQRSLHCQPGISDAAYVEKINQIKRLIQAGETYEACLTQQLSVVTHSQPLALYSVLRAQNPAPYSAYLRFAELSVLSASPEKFLHIDSQGRVETKPIKGTRARSLDPVRDQAIARELSTSPKDRAENVMIVDLLRNDLSKVSVVGSVKVSKLFAVESFATVHQLVSTINSQLAVGKTAIDCVAACFPGGSMTGAPKHHTLHLLGQLEKGPRGIYSGALGFFALNGSAHLNIVIRSIILSRGLATIGVGGAIVEGSDPVQELQEIKIKARALLRALASSD